MNTDDRAASARLDMRGIVTALVALFVFTIPFEEMFTIPGLGSVARLIGLVVVPLAIVALFGGGRMRLHRPPLFVLLAALFVAWNLASFFWSYAPGASLRQVSTYVQLLVFVWLVAEFCRGRERWLLLGQSFVVGNYVAFAIVTFTVLGGAGGEFRNVGRFDPNDFATVLALGIPLAALLMTHRLPRILQLLNAAYPVVATFGVVLAASRGGLIVCLVALAVVPFSFARFDVLRRAILVVSLMAAAGFSFVYAPQVFPSLYQNVERLAGTVEELESGTLTGRTLVWRGTLDLFLQSPLVGVGSGASRFALVETSYGRVLSAHNALLSVAASTGLIGLLLFVSLIVIASATGLLAAPKYRPFLLVLAAALLVAMMPLNIEARKATWFILIMLALHRPMLLSAMPPPAVTR